LHTRSAILHVLKLKVNPVSTVNLPGPISDNWLIKIPVISQNTRLVSITHEPHFSHMEPVHEPSSVLLSANTVQRTHKHVQIGRMESQPIQKRPQERYFPYRLNITVLKMRYISKDSINVF
jgi:hypothetical protein